MTLGTELKYLHKIFDGTRRGRSSFLELEYKETERVDTSIQTLQIFGVKNIRFMLKNVVIIMFLIIGFMFKKIKH